jgi:hypothetical protein
MKLQNRLILLGIASAIVGGFVYSHVYMHEKNREELRAVANELAYNWKQQLGLTEEQTSLLEDLIIEFTIRKNDVISEISTEKVKIQKLKKVQVREHRKLKKVLSPEQFETYINMNKRIPNRLMDS